MKTAERKPTPGRCTSQKTTLTRIAALETVKRLSNRVSAEVCDLCGWWHVIGHGLPCEKPRRERR